MDMDNIANVIGRNIRTIRKPHTMDTLATIGRSLGTNWSGGSIGAIEDGRFKPSLDTLIIIGSALSTLTGRNVTLRDLIDSPQGINITPNLSMTPDEIAKAYSGFFPHLVEMSADDTPTPGEQRIASLLGWDWRTLRERSIELWGVPFETRRDEIAGESSTPQKRGSVTRTLLKQLS